MYHNILQQKAARIHYTLLPPQHIHGLLYKDSHSCPDMLNESFFQLHHIHAAKNNIQDIF